MSVTIECPACRRTIRAPDSIIGKQAKCPACQAAFTVAAGPPEPAPLADLAAPQPAPAPPKVRKPGAFTDFLLFRRMIAPLVIQILFWLGVFLSVVSAIGQVIFGLVNIKQLGAGIILIILGALATVIIVPFIFRLFAELAILTFRMYDRLCEIKDLLEKQRVQT